QPVVRAAAGLGLALSWVETTVGSSREGNWPPGAASPPGRCWGWVRGILRPFPAARQALFYSFSEGIPAFNIPALYETEFDRMVARHRCKFAYDLFSLASFRRRHVAVQPSTPQTAPGKIPLRRHRCVARTRPEILGALQQRRLRLVRFRGRPGYFPPSR